MKPIRYHFWNYLKIKRHNPYPSTSIKWAISLGSLKIIYLKPYKQRVWEALNDNTKIFQVYAKQVEFDSSAGWASRTKKEFPDEENWITEKDTGVVNMENND